MSRLCAMVALALTILISGCQTYRDTFGNVAYSKGHDADREGRYEEAFAYFSMAAESRDYPGWASAQYRVAEMYLTGKGTKPDPVKAVALFKDVAASNDPTWRSLALAELGELHENGIPDVVKVDRVAAAKYYKASAESGLDVGNQAYQRLAAHPEVYVETHPDLFQRSQNRTAPGGMALAFKLFESGDQAGASRIFDWHARNGNEEAQFALAAMYREGIGVTADAQKYLGWTWLAARNGNPRAQFRMGLTYAEGEILLGSDEEAAAWMTVASAQGHAEATNWLGILAAYPLDEDRSPDWPAAVKHFRDAVRQGSVGALVNLADATYKGNGQPADKARAREMYEIAADHGSVLARTRLFERYEIAYTPKPSQADAKEDANRPTGRMAGLPTKPAPTKPSPVDVYERLSPSVFRLFAGSERQGASGISQGSAVAITESVAVTNCHVLEGMEAIAALFGDDIVPFSLLVGSRKRDICLVRTDHKLTPVASIRRYDSLRVGEKVYALGSPISLENTFSDGIVSGLRTMDGVTYIQTSAPISSGSSGGGLFDEDGQLIGITTLGVVDGENLNFAVAIDEAIAVINAEQ